MKKTIMFIQVNRKNASPSASRKVSRLKLQDEILATKGKFFSVTFTKKDGSQREMTCRLGVHKNQVGGTNNVVKDSNSYMTVFSVNDDDYRTINLSTISEFKFAKETVEVV